MAVRIRMKKLGRKHRPFYRICAVDSRSPRDGRVIEELGTYDTSIADTDARCSIKGERVQYWLGVGAQPSDKVRVLVKKYGLNGTHLDAQAAARERMALPKAIPDPGEPAFKLEPKAPKAEAGPDAAAAQAPSQRRRRRLLPTRPKPPWKHQLRKHQRQKHLRTMHLQNQLWNQAIRRQQ